MKDVLEGISTDIIKNLTPQQYAGLMFVLITLSEDDASVCVTLAVESAPSPWKEALSLGVIYGEFEKEFKLTSFGIRLRNKLLLIREL